jgi:hypothetical protein
LVGCLSGLVDITDKLVAYFKILLINTKLDFMDYNLNFSIDLEFKQFFLFIIIKVLKINFLFHFKRFKIECHQN